MQGEAQATFAERMYRYHYRLNDRYPDKDIVLLAILTDTRPSFARSTASGAPGLPGAL